MIKKLLLYCSLMISFVFTKAQNLAIDSSQFVQFDCAVIQTKEKLDKHFFASTPAIHLRVNNENFSFASLQLGKRKNKIYMHVRILEDNVCLKKDKNLDIYFKSGEIMTLKNEYPLNCESFFARELKKKELEKLISNDIAMIKIYTYYKNFELYVHEVQNKNIVHNIECLNAYKIKKSEEVTIKRKKK